MRAQVAVALLCASLAGGAARAQQKPPAKAIPNLPLPEVEEQKAAPAPAPAPPVERWSAVGTETNQEGLTSLYAELGFPGLAAGFTRAASDQFDWGVKVGMPWGRYGTTTTQLGLSAQVPLRFALLRKDKLSFVFRFEPGLQGYLAGGLKRGEWGLALPVGASLAYQVLPELRLALTADVPIALDVQHADLYLGPQFGFGAEYLVERRLTLGVQMRFGPLFVLTAGGDAAFSFVAAALVGYRL